MGSIGTPEIIVIVIIALLLFGPTKLPELGKSLGRAIREFKKATAEIQDSLEREVDDLKSTVNDQPDHEQPRGALPPSTPPRSASASEPGEGEPAAKEGEEASPAHEETDGKKPGNPAS
ncbi:MAG: twin-arginine translocase TatA/TatE family subunit [Acidobacteriota bacterium]|jgi:TatA/E family protein of Tat protein translocase